MIKTNNLTKVFFSGFFRKKTVALNKLNLEVKRGEIFGYLGPNGAGKTTSIKLFVGLIKPTSGEVKVADKDVRKPEARKIIGFLPENPFFYDYLTAEEFLNFYASIYHLSKQVRRDRIKFLLELTGLYEVRKKQLRVFSKGMMQRIGIAQALIGNPELIILDEPMVGLDPVGRSNIRNLIFKLRQEGKTVFFSTHILSDVEMVCDRVGILVNGELKNCGSLADILSHDVSQVEVIISGVNVSFHKELQGLADNMRVEGSQAFIRLNTDARLEGLLKFAMDKKLIIESVTRRRKSLEEIFLKEIVSSKQIR